MDRENDKDLLLFTPGPVNLSKSAASALSAPTIHHRTEDFERMMGDLISYLKSTFFTDGKIAVMASSGTGGMEALVANFIATGRTPLIPVMGKFSQRWTEICNAYGVKTHILQLQFGESPEPGRIADILSRLPFVDAILLTHCETSTGALTDIKAVADVANDISNKRGSKILIGVDCISTLCVDEFKLDQWGIDFAVSVSQKGMLAPAGLAFIAVGKQALGVFSGSSPMTYYFDIKRYLVDEARHPFTPPVNLVRASYASIREILFLGLEKVWRSYSQISAAITDLIESAGLRRVAKQSANACLAFWADPIDADLVIDRLRRKHGILIAGGQENLRGRVFRISPLGKSSSDLVRFALALKDVLGEMGIRIEEDKLDQFMKKVEEETLWE
ncbi:MAG: pyridoxal-phosphate-dependent aminotransferase family protein [bacterium]